MPTSFPKSAMTVLERRSTWTVASIYGLRMLGFFLIIPVFALYAEKLPDSTPFLIGLAIGIYGLTQMLLQIPMGWLSDRFGRKSIITLGLIIFALGSVIAGCSESLAGVIIGRAIQGAGAISASLMALAADLTRFDQRTKIMAFIGVTIGLSFTLALILGPLLYPVIGVPGLFFLTATLACLAIAALWFLVPTPVTYFHHRDIQPVWTELRAVFKNHELVRLNLGVFSLHFVITSLFLALPLKLKVLLGEQPQAQSHFYLAVMISAFMLMLPFVMLGERKQKLKTFFIGAILVATFSEIGFYFFSKHLDTLFITTILFFSAFNLLEASMPSLISKIAPAATKGTSMGVYSALQFFGAFSGGVAGGFAYTHFGLDSIFLLSSVVCALWFLIALGMKNPPTWQSAILDLKAFSEQKIESIAKNITKICGVEECVFFKEERTAYLKIDPEKLDQEALLRIQKQGCNSPSV